MPRWRPSFWRWRQRPARKRRLFRPERVNWFQGAAPALTTSVQYYVVAIIAGPTIRGATTTAGPIIGPFMCGPRARFTALPGLLRSALLCPPRTVGLHALRVSPEARPPDLPVLRTAHW